MKIPQLFACLCCACCILLSLHCGQGDASDQIAKDSASIARGEGAFTQHCSSCHNFLQDGIGPQLAGITEQVPATWIATFIHDPKKVIDAGDARAKMLFDKFHTVMPSFSHLPDSVLNDIIAYMHVMKAPEGPPDNDTTYLRDPITAKIGMSDIVLKLEEFAQIPFSSDKQPRTRIVKLAARPGTGQLFMLDLRGKLYHVSNGKAEVYMDMKLLQKNFIDEPGLATGFGSFAFHPDFTRNGLLYTSHTEPKGTAKADFGYDDSIPIQLQWVVTEWKTDPVAFPFKGEAREVFRINMVTGIHGMQELTFNPLASRGHPDYGMLYIGIGDGGCVENGFPSLVLDPARPWGSILRIDPRGTNSRNKKYGIPAHNPFVKDSTKLPEMFAYGFRNPHRITWSSDGKMLVANIGQASVETLDLILPGHNYGWPIREGNFSINPKGNINKAHELPGKDSLEITYPVAQYDHDEGKAISGGYEYTGSNLTALKGKYIFGDLNNGRLFFVETKDLKVNGQSAIREMKVAAGDSITTIRKLCGSERVDMRFGRDAKGEIYVFTKRDGKIYRIAGVSRQP